LRNKINTAEKAAEKFVALLMRIDDLLLRRAGLCSSAGSPQRRAGPACSAFIPPLPAGARQPLHYAIRCDRGQQLVGLLFLRESLVEKFHGIVETEQLRPGGQRFPSHAISIGAKPQRG
jgi:hypothetical protein